MPIFGNIPISVDQEINQEITYDTQADQKNDQEIIPVDQIADQKAKILALITSNPKITRLEIGKTIRLHDSSVKRRLESLISEGFIRRVGSTKGVHWEMLNFH